MFNEARFERRMERAGYEAEHLTDVSNGEWDMFNGLYLD